MYARTILAGSVALAIASALPAVWAASPPSQIVQNTVMQEKAGPVQFRSLQAVEDARARNTKWEDAAHVAAQRVDEHLRTKLLDRLNQLAPQIAAALMKQPGDSAVVTIAVYRDESGKAGERIAVAYEGMGESLNPSFFPRVIADMPAMDKAAKDQGHLLLDETASSYLIFYLNKGDLKAGDLAQDLMKKSLGAALARARQDTGTAVPPAGSKPMTANAAAANRLTEAARQRQEAEQQLRNNAAIEDGANAPLNNGLYYPPNGGWQPYWIVLNGQTLSGPATQSGVNVTESQGAASGTGTLPGATTRPVPNNARPAGAAAKPGQPNQPTAHPEPVAPTQQPGIPARKPAAPAPAPTPVKAPDGKNGQGQPAPGNAPAKAPPAPAEDGPKK